MAQVALYGPEVIQSECRNLRRILSYRKYNHKRRLKRLYLSVMVEYETLKHAIDPMPESNHNQDNRKSKEYEQAYRLLGVQINNMLEGWSQPIKSMIIDRAPKDNEVKPWIDYQYYLEDSIEDNDRFNENMFRQRILNCLAVIDTIDRLLKIGLPNIENEENLSIYLLTAFETTKAIRRNLLIALHRRRIWEIPLSKGNYPPVESTRIISHAGSQRKGIYVIQEIVGEGYTYKNSILRKVSVIVTTQFKEI